MNTRMFLGNFLMSLGKGGLFATGIFAAINEQQTVTAIAATVFVGMIALETWAEERSMRKLMNSGEKNE